MVVVLMAVFMLKTPEPISEISFSCQAGIAYYSHCPIDGSKANLRIFLSDQLVKVADGGVALGIQENIEDLLSLFAVEHAAIFQVLSEDGFFGFHSCFDG